MRKTTVTNKARLIRDTLHLSHFATEFMRRDTVEANPLTWLLELDGLLVDIRHESVQLQERAFKLGLIPFVPGATDRRA